jgi:hypothetical protein
MVSKIDQYGDLRNGILPLTSHVMLSGKVQVARCESKAPYRRRPSVDLNVAVAQLSRVLQMVEAMTYPDCPSLQDPSTLALIRIPGNGHSGCPAGNANAS